MIGARIDDDSLEVQITGRDFWPHLLNSDKLWAGGLILRLPLDHITAARVNPPKRGIRYMNRRSRVLRNGRLRGGNLSWCRRGQPVLFLYMDGQPYHSVSLSVPDPEQLAEAIRAAAGVRELTPEAYRPLAGPPRRRRSSWWRSDRSP